MTRWTPLLISLSVLIQGCGEPVSAVALPQRVILISIDTLRADHLSLYGYPRRTSPLLDAFAEQAVVFDDVSAPSPWTLPAHASLFTGLYPRTHRLSSHERRLRARFRGLAEILSDHGFHTAAVVNSYYLSRRFGLDRGFRDFVYVKENVDSIRGSEPITDQAIEWLYRHPDQPLFLFVHYYAGDPAHLIDRYDASIRQMDVDLERLFTFLREQRWLDESLIVVTSDHGEAFLEHGTVCTARTSTKRCSGCPS